MEHLYHLGALDEEGLMTRLGRKMAEFPMDPSLSKVAFCFSHDFFKPCVLLCPVFSMRLDASHVCRSSLLG